MRRFPTLLSLALVVALAPATSAVSSATPDAHVRRHDRADPHTWQTSDRVVGPERPTLPTYARAVMRSTLRFRYQVRPGLRISSYQQRIGARNIRYFVVRANWRTPGLGFALAQPPHYDDVQTVRWMTHNTKNAVAGVNGDFFDIGRTGAPLGLGVRGGTVEHGINWGWNSAFFVNRDGVPHIGTKHVKISAPLHPKLGLTNLNSPWVRPGGIGVYTPKWGRTAGYAWTDGQKRNIAMAHVVDHKVVAIRTMFKAGTPVTGQYLVARGAAAVERLHRLHVGDPLWLRTTVANRPRMAVTGNEILMQRGRILATDDTELHPRTAVGIDPYHHWVFLLVVEGRQEFSDGYTMVELARKLKHLGCTSALNFDGGGSTTLVAQHAGDLRVLNSPSDGTPRKVANGLAVTYRRPARHHHHHR
jgi:hypothetical protein